MKNKPDILFVMYNGNDISLLAKTGSYYNAPIQRTLIIDINKNELHEKYKGVVGLLRRMKDFFFS